MNPNPSRTEALFLAAAEIPEPPERAAFLDRECGGDLALRARVEALLASHDDAGDFLQTAAPSPEMEAEFARLKPEESGERIGHYKLLQNIGEGGFGMVWMAEQEQPVRRQVALKIIKLGMDTKEVIARFEQERQALALMDHPNIAKVLDAGATPTGRPFFVMELVRGIRITDYCDQHNLPTADRLQLFIAVCHAVQHAHQKGLIHRDLKPSNIMVTLHDGVPVPKVIDFGVAKAMQQQRLTDLTLFTQFEQMIGTPLYMSPEQAELSGLDIDTRSDIYSLGVLLYELLVGRTPFDPAELMQKGVDEIRRTIREQEPQTPSMFVRTMAADLRTNVAQHRQSDGAKLIGLIRGDLDWIVMKALEKDRARRYDTASDLAKDLERHLTSEPVLARPVNQLYRFRRLVRRNKLAFAAGSAVVLALLAGIAVSAWEAVRATNAEQTAGEERNKAVAERDRALTAEQEAKEQRQMAETARGKAERNLYAANMNLISGAWVQTNMGRLREILEETRSYPDRGFEWYYWQRQIHLELRTLRGHKRSVTSVAFSPDGRRIATGSFDKSAKVWDAETGRELLTLKGHESYVTSVAFSPDGRRVVTGSIDKMARLWDAETGRELLILRGHKNYIQSVAFSPDGRRISTGSFDNSAKVWDAETGNELLTLKRNTGVILGVAFSRDGRRLATCHGDGVVKVWDAEAGSELLTLKGHNHSIQSVAFSPDGRRLATGSMDKTARVWDAETGRELLSLNGHNNEVHSVAFSPDGSRIVTGGFDNSAKVWDAETGRELLSLKAHTGGIEAVAFSPDGQQILTGSADMTAKVWDAEANREVLTLNGHTIWVKWVAFSPNGRRIVTGSADRTAKVWDAATGREILTIKGQIDGVNAVCFSPDGHRLVTACEDYIYAPDGVPNTSGTKEETAKVWDAEDGRELLTLEGHKSRVSSVAFAPDGRWIVTGSLDTTAKLWDAETGRELLTMKGHKAPIQAVAFSPDGRRIATGSADKTTKLWDAERGRELFVIKGHTSDVWSVAFSPDGRRIVTGSTDKSAKIWDAETGGELLTLRGHKLEVRSVAFSPDGRRIATGSADKTTKVWDVETGHELLTLNRHTEAVWSVVFSPDGQRIVTGSGDQTAKVWMAASPEEVEGWRTADAVEK